MVLALLFSIPAVARAEVDSSGVALVGGVPGYIFSVEVDTSRNLLFAGGPGGVAIVDISSPSAPVHLSSLPFEVVLDVSVDGNILLVSAYEQGLAVVDISDPSSPHLLSVVNLPGQVADVAYGSGNVVFMASRYTGIFSIDISNPASPMVLDTFSAGVIYEIYARNDTVFAAGGSYDFFILDASDPSNLSFVSGHTSGFFSWATDLKVVGDTVFLADMSEGLRVVDISNPVAPVDVDSLELPGYVQLIDIRGGYAYAGTSSDSLFSVNLSTMSVEGQYEENGDLRDIVVSGDYLFAAASSGGVSILGTPSLSPSGAFYTPSFTVALVASGGYAYAGDWNAGLTVLDVSSISSPKIVKTFPSLDFVQDLYLDGDYLYVAHAYEGLYVINLSDPSDPFIDGNYNTSGVADGIYVSGGYAYVADNYGDLVVLDVSIPQVPSLVTTFQFPGRAMDVVGRDTLLFIAAGDSGLVVVNVSDPSSPSLVSQFVPPSSYIYSSKVYLVDSFLFLANYYELYVLSVSDPASPYVLVVDSFGGQSVMDVNGYGNLVYITVWDSGMRVLDLSSADPLTPAGYYDPYISSLRDGIAPMDSLVLISAGISGVWAFRSLIPLGDREYISHPASPIRFTIFRDGILLRGRGRYEIYSVGGRKIAEGYSFGDTRIPLRRGVYVLRMGPVHRKFVIP